MTQQPLALSFDVFGTVVDWRSGVARESGRHLAALGRDDDPAGFADAWRRRYQPAMNRVRSGERPFVVLDVLHRETLEAELAARGLDPAALGEERLADWTRAWHRLDPWPDSVAGLERLRRRFPLVTLSNGNVALVVAMARRAGLPWDAVLGAETSRHYKPDREAYLSTAAMLDVPPGRLLHVAAHHSDLAHARDAGLMTAHVDRPMEYGGAPAPDRDQRQDWDWSVASMTRLADALGA